MTTVWVYAEVTPEGPSPSALELLTKARTIGDEVAAVALGPGATGAAPALGEHGAARVYASDEQVYADTLGQPAAHTLHALIREHTPDLVLFSTSYDARDLAGRLQARLGSALMSNVTDVTAAGSAQTQIFGGNRVVDVTLEGPAPRLLLVRPKSFAPEPNGGTAEIVPVDTPVPDELTTVRRIERHEETAAGPRLEDAKVVIAGGRGLQDPSNFKLLDDLAAAIGDAAVGASRKIGASPSLLIATIRLAPFIPTTCCVAPLIPTAMYTSGLTVLPVWPTWYEYGTHPASTTARLAPTAASPIAAARSSRSLKFDGSWSPRPPAKTTFASSSRGPAAVSS